MWLADIEVKKLTRAVAPQFIPREALTSVFTGVIVQLGTPYSWPVFIMFRLVTEKWSC